MAGIVSAEFASLSLARSIVGQSEEPFHMSLQPLPQIKPQRLDEHQLG